MNKKGSGFVHLHVHSEYSLLDGLENCENLINRAKELNMNALAVTDHGTMRGLVSFYEIARKNNINPILGQEFYFRPNRHEKDHTQNLNYHTTILIKNLTGWKNCINLTTEANLTGYYYKPRIDIELLTEYSDGLMLGSGCIGSMTNQLILQQKITEAKSIFDEYIRIFKDDFYIELATDSQSDQKIINDFLLRYAKDNGIVYTIMSDVHWASKDDFKYHDVLLSLQTRSKYNDPDRFRFPTKDTWMKSEDEMWEFYYENCIEYMSEEDFFNAMSNTSKISKKCNDLFLEDYYNEYRMPNTKMDDPFKSLLDRSIENRPNYIKDLSSDDIKKYNDRLHREIKLIVDQGFADYFVMTADLTDYMKEQNIMKGLGRGSAGGSLLAFMLGITDIDPLIHNLSFERFMNENKKSMPDIDIDIDDEKRQDILDYFIEKYGNDNVAQIGTYVALQEKSALKDVAWSFDLDYDSVNKITKRLGTHEFSSLTKMTDEEFRKFLDDPSIGRSFKRLNKLEPEWIPIAKKIKGVPKAIGKHPAGIVVGNESLRNLVPLQKAKGENNYVTEWIDGTYRKELTETLKLVKFDLLGLSNLGIIQNIITLIRERKSKNSHKFDLSLSDMEVMNSIPLDDPNVFSLFPSKLLGIFQFETNAVQSILKHVLPENLKELCALNSLNRPATKQLIEDFADNREKTINYTHPILEEVLDETYGVILYQEQVMDLAHRLGGIPLSETDDFRKALVKFTDSNKEEQERLRKTILERFVKGSIENGLEEKYAINISENMAKFAGYGFNKSHSMAYSILSYYTLYLKYYFEDEFYTAYLNKRMENLPQVISEVGLHKFLPVDINLSSKEYKLENDKIRIGFSAVKNLGASAINEIVSNQPYTSVEDLQERCNRSKCNKTRILALKRVGAFHDYGVISNIKSESPLLGYKDQTIAVRYNRLIGVKKYEDWLDGRFKEGWKDVFNLHSIEELNEVPETGVESFCCVIGYISKFELKETVGFDGETRQAGFTGEIIDSTGSCKFVRWDHRYENRMKAPTIDLYVGAVVMLRGKKKSYSGKPQITLPTSSDMKKWRKWGNYINMDTTIYYCPPDNKLCLESK